MATSTVISDWNKLGALLKDTRIEFGWTQVELAHRAGVSRAWLAKVERGHRGAELEHVLRLLSALNLSLVAQKSGTFERPETPSVVGADESAVARALSARVAASERRKAAWASAKHHRHRSPTEEAES